MKLSDYKETQEMAYAEFSAYIRTLLKEEISQIEELPRLQLSLIVTNNGNNVHLPILNQNFG